ncbi:hypothetical protein BVC71_10330 [Marivivens niveibacter]|uniref:diguanylate cyclase n=1 Tax=Marivivens niveibacter TaxID=1930667 RepID=A0A251WY96_9RHOB|nr:diguanylate cyclase [Marivivens niveibacter]OUD09098.1 hypothetical protein BVC71_10330 [Marivivens niveibacter]
MSGRIIIIDTVATNRIVLKVKLMTAQYKVTPCATIAEAQQCITDGDAVDLIVADVSSASRDMNNFFQFLSTNSSTGNIPIIATGTFDSSASRIETLRSGATEVLSKPVSDMMLLARIRSLLRSRAVDNELKLRDDTSRALGFAEGGDPFIAPGKVALVSNNQALALPLSRDLSAAMASRVRSFTHEDALSIETLDTPPDLYVIDARHADTSGEDGRVFRLIAELRSRNQTRNAAQLIIAPENGDHLGAMALDLGANDVVPYDATAAEIGLRARGLVRRKIRMEKLRDTVQSGLKAAVTDPLTGLYNRRYAMPHLQAMADRAIRTNRSFALMALDIDHFKSVNDTYGHTAGDKVISAIAELIRDSLRPIDLVARIGGEEFLVAMPDTSVAAAQKTAERLRFLVQNTPIDIGNMPPVTVTMSIGLAVSDCSAKCSTDINQLIDYADAALYDSKAAGRNIVTLRDAA